MSLAQRFERRLEGVVGSAFARVFKGQVEPVEIGRALQREAGDKRAVMGSGQVLAPNRYRVSLSPSDHERLIPWDAQLCNSLAELVQEYLDEHHWATVGDVEVVLHLDPSLRTGIFGVASRMEAAAPPRRRPYDSLSLPLVPGREPGQYEHPFDSQPVQLPASQPVDPGPGGPPGPAPVPEYYSPYEAAPYEAAPYEAAPNEAAPNEAAPYEAAAYDAPGRQAVLTGRREPAPSQPPNHPGPPRPTPARVMITVDGSDSRLALRPGSNVIGRGHDSDLQLVDQGVSRKHLDVQFDGQVAVAYDLGSTNGTSVNGHPIGSHQLQHGDVLRIGHSRLVFHQERG